MDNNFEILEQEIDRLVAALSQLREENDQLKEQLNESISLQKKTQDELELLRQHEKELKTVKDNHEAVRDRIKGLLERLNKIDSNI
jgi:FtsZ-binding cell division protein ZapB